MKYFIVEADNEFTLFKVADNLVECFKNEHLAKVLVEGNSIMEALLSFEQSYSKDNSKPFDIKSAKYKHTTNAT